MRQSYTDIIEEISKPVEFWDENGTPRFKPFHPTLLANIYAEEAVLLEISCQGCEHEFIVAMSQGGWQRVINDCPYLREDIVDGSIHYGDPPNTDCCAAGPTMNCNDLRVLEYWKRDHDWVRDSTYERTL